jgi:hypothetical protein
VPIATSEEIVVKAFAQEVSANLEIPGEFLPLLPTEASRRLFDLRAKCAQCVGLSVGVEFA